MNDNLNLEIFRFKIRLRELDLDDLTIDRCVTEFNSRLQEAIEEVLNGGLSEAQSLAIQKDSKEFLAELRADARNFQLLTDSGQTDFSIAPFSMRPGLLSNAKMGKNGRYRVIPIGKDTGRQNPMAMSSADVARYAAKEQQEEFRAKLAARQLAKGSNAHKEQEFRTISERQDPSTWMHPGFSRDFTSDLERINSDMKYKVHQYALQIMREIEERAYKGEV